MSITSVSTFAMLLLISFWLIMLVLCAVLILSPSGGGGGGSGGSVMLSSCTLTAGSGASIEAKGGNGGQARSWGENGLVYRCFISMYITNLSTS